MKRININNIGIYLYSCADGYVVSRIWYSKAINWKIKLGMSIAIDS